LNWGCVSRLAAIQPEADSALGISQRPKPYLSGFLMPISNRWVFLPWSRSNGLNFSNRRVRTRTHGGVAGVSGQPLPLCRSNRPFGQCLQSRVFGKFAYRRGRRWQFTYNPVSSKPLARGRYACRQSGIFLCVEPSLREHNGGVVTCCFLSTIPFPGSREAVKQQTSTIEFP